MLLDAAKGLEPQTLKLFEVCRYRRIPVITFVNKWDRPGREALELADELADRLKLHPMPLTWPVGSAGEFAGVLDRRSGDYIRFTRTVGGATAAPEERLAPDEARERAGATWETTVEESELLSASGHDYDGEAFLAGTATPLLFGSAVQNFGVRQLLDLLLELAPPPTERVDVAGQPRPLDAPYTGFVFKVQAGMDTAHRDRLAFLRVCSGVFERGMVVTHGASGRPFATKYAQAVFGRERATIDTAYPGDVIGLVNAAALRVGDSLYVDEPVTFPPIPSFAPEYFAVARAADSGRYKQFRRGIEQLEQEGVVQVLRSDLRGEQAPVLAVVGPMQFEVAAHRMAGEFSAPIHLERLDYTVVRAIAPADVTQLQGEARVEVLTRSDGELLVLFSDKWRLASVQRAKPDLQLRPLLAETS
jgi:peptide chain release factor 3